MQPGTQPLAMHSRPRAIPRRPVRGRLTAFAWSVLAYNIAVILWGALVRATGSGAGCGGHWPLCNGDVVPSAPQIATLIELTHRVMSGVALAAVAALFVWTRASFPSGPPSPSGDSPWYAPRRWATLSLVFIVTEALLGAGLVLLGYVAKDASAGRAVWLCAHLINTFLLLASLAMTAWTSSLGPEAPAFRPASGRWYVGAVGALVAVAMAGVITALGDTLFPADSLAGGFADDFSVGAPFLVKLRVIHPILAILASVLIVTLALPEYRTRRTPRLAALAGWLISLVAGAVAAGALTLLWRAPVPMQILHLSIADSLWIALVLFTSERFRCGPVRHPGGLPG